MKSWYKGNIINCTLWKSYGSKFLTYYDDVNSSGAIVIVLAMIKDSQGIDYFLYVL